MLGLMASALGAPEDDFARLWVETYTDRATGVFPNLEANVAHICRALGVSADGGRIAEALDMRLSLTRRTLAPRDDAVETLTRLRAVGHKTGLISDCSEEVPRLWRETAFATLVDEPVFSCVAGVKKPDPRIYRLACERLEVEPESFDCALMSLMMHHLEDHGAAFREVFAALRPGGALLIRQGTLAQILRDPVHRFFPEAVAIDRRRTPFRSEVEWWLQEAGFDPVEAEEFKQTSYPSNERFLKEMRLRVCSVLRLMSDEAFEAGLRRLTRYARTHPEDSSLRQDLFTLFTARRPG